MVPLQRLALFLGVALGLAHSAAMGAEPAAFSVGSFEFERPEGWTWVVPTSPMRKAELSPPAVEGEASTEVTFFHFGAGQGGSPEANMQRWLSQFQEPIEQLNAQTAETLVGDNKVLLLSAEGTFLAGMPGGPTTPMPDYALRSAILISSGGDVYVKMTGPKKSVDAAAGAFDAMISGARAVESPGE